MGSPINPLLGLRVNLIASADAAVAEAKRLASAVRESQAGIVDAYGRRAPVLDALAKKEETLASSSKRQAAEATDRARVIRDEFSAMSKIADVENIARQRAVRSAAVTHAALRDVGAKVTDLSNLQIAQAKAVEVVRIAAETKVTESQKAQALIRNRIAKAETAAYVENARRMVGANIAVGSSLNLGLLNRYTGALRTLGFAFSRTAGQGFSLVNAGGRLTSASGEITAGIGASTLALGGFAVAAAAAGAALIYAAHEAANWDVTIARAAASTGATTLQLSGIALAAKQMNIDLQTVERSMVFLSRGLGEGTAAGERFRATIKALGINTHDAHTGALLPFNEILPRVIDRLGKADAGSRTLAASMNIMSRSTTEQGANLVSLLRVIARMPGGLQGWIDKARELGMEVTPESSKKALEYKYAITELTTALHGLSMMIGRTVLPTLTTLLVGVRNGGLLWDYYRDSIASSVLAVYALGEATVGLGYAMTGNIPLAIKFGKAARDTYDLARFAADKAADSHAKYDAAVSAGMSTLRIFAEIVQATSGERLPEFGRAITAAKDRLAELIQKYRDEIEALKEVGTKREAALRSYEAEVRAIDSTIDALRRKHKLTQEDIRNAAEARRLAYGVYAEHLIKIMGDEEAALGKLISKYKDEIEAAKEGTSAREAALKHRDAELRAINTTYSTLEREGKLSAEAVRELAQARLLAHAAYVAQLDNISQKETDRLIKYLAQLQEQTTADESRAKFKEGDFIEGARLEAQKVEATTRAASEIEKKLADEGGHYELLARITEDTERRIEAAWHRASSTVANEVEKQIKASEKLVRREMDLADRLESPITARLNRLRISFAKIQRDYEALFDSERRKLQDATRAYQQNAITVQQWARAVTAASAAVQAAKRMEAAAYREAMVSAIAGIAGIIAGIRVQAAIEAIWDTAKGIRALAEHRYKDAALHFAAAVEFGLIAGGVGQGGSKGRVSAGGGGGGRGSELNPASLTPEQQAALLAPGTYSPYAASRGLQTQRPVVMIEAHVMGTPNHAAYVADLLNQHTTTRGGLLIASKTIAPPTVSRGGRP